MDSRDVPAAWRKSSHSNGQGGQCIEVARAVPGPVVIRDSKAPYAGVLVFPSSAWHAFLGEIR